MRQAIALTLTLGALAVFAAPAGATFHLVKVREVYPGSAAQGRTDAFVELQMFAPGQELVGGHAVLTFAADGSAGGSFPFAADVVKGDSQRSVLLGGSAVAGADTTAAGLGAGLDPAGGAVCWDATRLDCVAWGAFNNAAALPTGPPAAAIPDGLSLNRSIAAGCPTLLESADDTGSSAADFTLAAPTPRNNATVPSESACGVGADTQPPQTTIVRGPGKRTSKPRLKVSFRSSEPGSSFECKLDQRGYRPCSSPFKAKIATGRHAFKVFATDPAGNPDPSPAKLRFKRTRRPRR